MKVVHKILSTKPELVILFVEFLQSSSSRGSLILIDRTLDLVGASGHSFDTLADRIIQLLPRLPQHTSDVAVDMSPLCSHGR